MAKKPLSDPRMAVDCAMRYFQENVASQNPVESVRVEEIAVLDKPKGGWHVTLGYDVIGQNMFQRDRQYKDFVLDKNFIVKTMKIRKLA